MPITKSEIISKEYPTSVVVCQMVYVECLCTSVNHIARAVCQKTVQEDGRSEVEVFFEFNGTLMLYPEYESSRIVRFVKFFLRRLKAAIKILFNVDLYLSPDFWTSAENMEALCFAIRESIEAIKNTPTKFDKHEIKAVE